MAGGGVGLVAWESQPSGPVPYNIEARSIAPNGTLGTATIVGEGAEGADYGFSPRPDGAGEPVLGWIQKFGLNDAMAGYDTVPPTLAAPGVPAATAVGLPTAFSVPTPLDIWSPPVTTSWSFGDGATASGTSATHIYARSGTYTVTVTATDALGNAISRSAQITVAATTAVAPGPTAARHCLVPTLRHLSLASAKSRLTKAGCALGKRRKAHRPGHHRGLSYGVLSQSSASGRSKPFGSKVNIALGWFKAPRHTAAKRHKGHTHR